MGEDWQAYLVRLVQQKGILRLRERLLLGVLTALSWLYRLAVWLRNKLYDLGIAHTVKLPCMVVSVGNLTTGGTGKTPLVEYLARLLQADGWKVCILSRGYRSGLKDKTAVGIVSDVDGIRLSPEIAGDEAYLLAKNLPGIPVMICKDRSRAGKVACEKFGCEVAILDDGFQHRRLGRNLEVVAIDATNPWGNGYFLPRGFLRDHPRELRRADMVVITRADQVSSSELAALQNELRRRNSAASVFPAVHGPVGWMCLTGTDKYKERSSSPTDGAALLPLNELRGRKVIAMSGIGNPGSFERTLRDVGVDVVGNVRFSDHHAYESADVDKITSLARVRGVNTVVTTEKDAVKLQEQEGTLDILRRAGLELYVLRVSLRPGSKAAFDAFFQAEVTKYFSRQFGEAGYS